MTKQVLDLFTGTANPELASEVSKILGINISKADVGYFSDGEIKVQIESNVRGHDTFILQSTCAPSNKNLMELMLLGYSSPIFCKSIRYFNAIIKIAQQIFEQTVFT